MELQYTNGGFVKSFFIFIIIFGEMLLSLKGFAQALECRRGESGEIVSIEGLVSEISPGSTLFLGELHGFEVVASGQMQVLEELRRQGHKVDVGLEFFTYTKQSVVDQFVHGMINEGTFLDQVGWAKSMDFGFYRKQALFPRHDQGEFTWAINAPQNVTRSVAKRGLENLTEEEKQLLPPNLELGRADYLDRFRESMGGHVEEKDLLRYFQAQSVWDETMAWQLTNHQTGNTKVVVVGEFHVQYGGGLPNRLSVRDPKMNIITLGFMNIHNLSASEIDESIKPHEKWGIRENFICLVDLPETTKIWSSFKGLGRSYR